MTTNETRELQMTELLTKYHPDFLKGLLIIYTLILILAMIRYGLEKIWFVEHLFYSLGIFFVTLLIGMQLSNKGYESSSSKSFLAMRNFGMGWGGCLLFYSMIMIIIFVIRCLAVKTKYVQINKEMNTVEIMSSWLWGTVLGAILWGSIMFISLGIGSLMYLIGQIKVLLSVD